MCPITISTLAAHLYIFYTPTVSTDTHYTGSSLVITRISSRYRIQHISHIDQGLVVSSGFYCTSSCAYRLRLPHLEFDVIPS